MSPLERVTSQRAHGVLTRWAGAVVARFLVGCVAGIALAACGAARPRHVFHWPASAPVSLEGALRATAAEESLPAPTLPDGVAAAPLEPHEHLPYDDAGIRARSALFEGLWYAEVVLGAVSPDEPLPLVVALHGRGDAPRLPGGPFRRVPTAMRLLIPRGPFALGDGYAWGRFSVASHHPGELAEDLGAAADRIARLVEHVRASRATLGTPIVTGFSQGAILAWMTALSHPRSVGIGLVIAGWVPPAARSVAPDPSSPRVRAMHGTVDEVIPIEGTREVALELGALGFDIELVEVAGAGHVVTDEMNLRFEGWLEEALFERAPDLGHGLGVAGPDPGPSDAYPTPIVEDADGVAMPAPLVSGASERR